MTKKFLVVILICLSVSFFVKPEAKAQLKYGAGIFYGTWMNNPGLNVRAEFSIGESLAAVPKINISIPRLSSGTFLNSVSLHMHYNVEISEELDVYPLAGITLKSYLDIDKYGNDRIFHQFGVNPALGAGGKIKLTDAFEVFAEGRFELGRYHQFVSTIGVLMTPKR